MGISMVPNPSPVGAGWGPLLVFSFDNTFSSPIWTFCESLYLRRRQHFYMYLTQSSYFDPFKILISEFFIHVWAAQPWQITSRSGFEVEDSVEDSEEAMAGQKWRADPTYKKRHSDRERAIWDMTEDASKDTTKTFQMWGALNLVLFIHFSFLDVLTSLVEPFHW